MAAGNGRRIYKGSDAQHMETVAAIRRLVSREMRERTRYLLRPGVTGAGGFPAGPCHSQT